VLVPDQKVTVGALNAMVKVVVKYFTMLLGTEGGGVYLEALRRSSQ